LNWSEVWQMSKPPAHWRTLASLYAFGWRAYELVYRLGIKRRQRVGVPIIGVGSLLVGGTGKTPATIALARLLKAHGMRPVVLCSGYGGKRWQSVTLLIPGSQPDPREVGEEPVEILNALSDVPVVVGRKRVLAARAAAEHFQPDIIVLDDGFQHLPLARDIDLVLLPEDAPLGNGYCLPAGPLREPVIGLQRASALLMISTEPSESSNLSCPSAPKLSRFRAVRRIQIPYRLHDGEEVPLDELRSHAFVALSGIAQPETFEAVLQQLNLNITTHLRFQDHHQYTQADIVSLVGKQVITTEKDAVKLRPFLSSLEVEIYVLPVQIEFEKAFEAWLLEKVRVWKQK
jgi:tetraacyldisaccharide 4'-kinase